MRIRLLLLVQLLGTLAIIAWLPTNLAKALALPVWWLLTFGKLNRAEIILYGLACVFFTVMDVLTVSAGQFQFNHPDLLGLPAFEPLMWGFYLLHTWRMVGGPIPTPTDKRAWLLAVLFAAAFSFVTDPTALLLTAGLLVGVGLLLYHQRHDLAFAGYMIFVGTAVEFTGVLSGQWHYPADPALGVPLWSATLWGGIGLLLRRMLLPTLLKFVGEPTPSNESVKPQDRAESTLTAR